MDHVQDEPLKPASCGPETAERDHVGRLNSEGEWRRLACRASPLELLAWWLLRLSFTMMPARVVVARVPYNR